MLVNQSIFEFVSDDLLLNLRTARVLLQFVMWVSTLLIHQDVYVFFEEFKKIEKINETLALIFTLVIISTNLKSRKVYLYLMTLICTITACQFVFDLKYWILDHNFDKSIFKMVVQVYKRGGLFALILIEFLTNRQISEWKVILFVWIYGYSYSVFKISWLQLMDQKIYKNDIKIVDLWTCNDLY